MVLTFDLNSRSERDTQELGYFIGSLLEQGDFIPLTGELGAGKTAISQGIAWGLGVEEYAHSPTFMLVNQYIGRVPLYHSDLYRIDDLGEIEDLGIEEMLQDGVCLVEWAEKAISVLPPENLHIEIHATGPNERHFHFKATGDRYNSLLNHLASTIREQLPRVLTGDGAQ